MNSMPDRTSRRRPWRLERELSRAGTAVRFETLETRLLFSADLSVSVGVDAQATVQTILDADAPASAPVIDLADRRLLGPGLNAPLSLAVEASVDERRELVVIDAAVPDATVLYDIHFGLSSGLSGRYEFLILDSGDDAFESIGRALLESGAGFDALHLFGHGSIDQMHLGASRIDGDSVLAHAQALSQWRAHLNDDADLLLYGCEIAAGPAGQSWLTLLAQLTGADVAASDDMTGSAVLGGDWVLEFQTGTIEAVLDPGGVSEFGYWGHVLAANQTTAGTQSNASVAVDAAGNSVVVWQSDGQDGSGWGVYAQRFDATGTPVGGEFLVSQTTAGDQLQPDVAMTPDGDFVIVWTGRGQDGDGPGEGNVYGRLFASDGTPTGGEFVINQITANDQSGAAVSFDGGGNTVMATWKSTGQDGSGSGIYARRLFSNGLAIGGEFQVNAITTGDQTAPDVAGNDLGSFMFVWQSDGQDGSGWGVYRRYYSVLGVFLNADWLVNEYTPGDQYDPAVAYNGANDFLIAWGSDGEDGSGSGIYANYIKNTAAGDGTSAGAFRVNMTTAGDQIAPTIGHDDDRNFVVAWTSFGQGTDAIGESSIYAQLLERHGSSVDLLGSEFLVHAFQTGNQQRPAVAMNDSGTYRVVWDGQLVDEGSGIDFQVYSNPFDNEPPSVSMAGSSLTYVENGAAVVLDNALTVVDDSGLLTRATVSIATGFQSGSDVLSAVAQPGIGVAFDGGTGVLTLSGMATVAAYQTTLRSVTYHNFSDAPNTQSRQISVVVDDSAATGSDTRGLTVQSVNDAPVLTGSNALLSILEDANGDGGTLVAALIDGWTSDPDAGASGGIAVFGADNTNGIWQYSTNGGWAWSAFGAPSAVNARLLPANASTYVRFVPNANWHGAVAGGLTFRAWDHTSGSVGGVADTTINGGSAAFSASTAMVGIFVDSVNDAPSGTDTLLALNEDASYTLTAADFGFADAADAPADGFVGVLIVSLPNAGTLRNNGIAVSAGQTVARADIDAGRLIYMPESNANGLAYASLGFQVRDGGGTANGGIDLDPTPNSIVFDVTAVNDAPVNHLPPAQYTAFDTPLTLGAASFNAITVADGDAGPNEIELVVVAGNGSLSLGATAGLVFTVGDGTNDATMIFRGTLSVIAVAFEGAVFTPTPGYSGTATLVLGAYDLGSTGVGGARTDDDTLLIHVAAADALSVVHDSYTAGEDTALIGVSVLDNDSDPLLGTLSVSAINGDAAAIGAQIVLASGARLTMNPDGTFVYDPAGAFEGVASGATTQDSFEYSVSSTSGRIGTGSVTIGIDGTNDAPVLSGVNDLIAVAEDAVSSAGTLVAALIDGHITDADSGALEGIAVIRVDDTNGTWQYSTDAGASWFAFGTPSVASARLLRADADNLVRFVPAANWSGAVAGGIEFRAWDGSNGFVDGVTADTSLSGGRYAYSSATASASASVTAINDAPDGTDRTLAVTEDGFHVLSAADFGFSDAFDTPGNALSAIQIVTIPSQGTLRLDGVSASAGQSVTRADVDAGRLRFAPTLNAYGAAYASFSFRVRDDGGTVSGGIDLDPIANTITFDVLDVNDAPSLTSFFGPPPSGAEDAAMAFEFSTLLGGSDATDVDGIVNALVVTGLSNGTLSIGTSAGAATPFAAGTNDVIDATRRAWWTPPTNAWGPSTAAFTVRALDDVGAVSSGSAIVRVNLVAVADRPVVSAATTPEDGRTTSGLVITSNPVDGAEVTHFRIEAIVGGHLFLADGVTPVLNEDFITVAQGLAGLVFEPTPDSSENGTFLVYGATADTAGSTGVDAALALVSVVPANDAPILTGIHDLLEIHLGEQGAAFEIAAMLAGYVTDVDSGSLSGAAIVGIDASHGTWHYTLDGGATWHVLSVASETEALLLAADPGVAIRFDPASGYLGTASVSIRAWDRTSGVSGTRADVTVTGGESAFSVSMATARVNVVASPLVPTMLPEDSVPTSGVALVQGAPVTTVSDPDLGVDRAVPDAVPSPKDPPASSGRAAARADPRDAQSEPIADVVPNADRAAAATEDIARPVAASESASATGVVQANLPSLPVMAGTRLVAPSDIDRLGQDFVAQPEKAVEAMGSQPLLNALDQVRESVADEATVEARIAAASVAVTGSLSAGYVMWLVRGGVLATSLMSSLPAWRVLDPLPVLSHRARRTVEDDESLESMVDGESTDDMSELEDDGEDDVERVATSEPAGAS